MESQSKNCPYHQILGDGTNVNTIDLTPVPLETANLSEVRSFIINVLVGQYDVDREHAQNLAQLWTVGSGRELRQFPARLFVEIFGSEAGWVLYKEVSARVIGETVKTMDVFDYKNRGMAYSFFQPLIIRDAYTGSIDFMERELTRFVVESAVVVLLISDIVLAVLWAFFEPIRLPAGVLFVMATLVILLFAAVGRGEVDARAKPESQLRWLFRAR